MVDGFYLEGKLLCGGRTFLEGLHARFARMHIWAVICFAQTGEWECGVSGRWWMDFIWKGSCCVVGALYRKDYMLALLACIFGP
ncbi:hypothetical protein GD462_14105 [Listeria monocytogenes]|nr:hypothetical protein [Listeria monocytogenes]EDJ0214694.1 hypothetical protein [Listeria monocytogenes]